MRPVDLIACGALNVDLIYRPPSDLPLWQDLGPPGGECILGAPARDALHKALVDVEPVRSAGGQAANTAHALSRLGYRAIMLGRVGADEDGAYLLDELAPADARFVTRKGHTGRVYVLLDEHGERRNLVWPEANDEFCVNDVPRRLPRSRFALFTSFVGDGPLEAQLKLLERLPPSTEIAFDPGEIYARKGVKRFLPILNRCSYLFANEQELETMCGLSQPESIEFLLGAGVDVVVCKMGSRGARLIGHRIDLYVPPLPAEVVDVTGAGDVFAAGFLAALLEQTGLEGAGRLGAWAASRGIAGIGRSRYPDAREWRERLAQERQDRMGVHRGAR